MATLAENMKEALSRQMWHVPYWVGKFTQVHTDSYILVPDFKPWRDHKSLPVEFPLHIWEMPLPGHLYSIAVDPSSGRSGGDPAGIQILNYRGWQVAELLAEECLPYLVTRMAVWLAHFYNDALLIIEANGVGEQMIQWASRGEHYENLWKWPFGRDGNLWLGTKLRDEMIKDLQDALTGLMAPRMHSFRLREQLDFDNAATAADDLVIAYVIGHYCSPVRTQEREYGGHRRHGIG